MFFFFFFEGSGGREQSVAPPFLPGSGWGKIHPLLSQSLPSPSLKKGGGIKFAVQ